MDVANNLMTIRKFLEDHDADEETMKAWMAIRDELTNLLYMAINVKGIDQWKK